MTCDPQLGRAPLGFAQPARTANQNYKTRTTKPELQDPNADFADDADCSMVHPVTKPQRAAI
jgi:hypothetical protein